MRPKATLLELAAARRGQIGMRPVLFRRVGGSFRREEWLELPDWQHLPRLKPQGILADRRAAVESETSMPQLRLYQGVTRRADFRLPFATNFVSAVTYFRFSCLCDCRNLPFAALTCGTILAGIVRR